MEILSLALLNFRNLAVKKMTFGEDLTVIVGPNGSGKSNILEACGLLAGLRASRIETDLDLVKFGKSEAKVESKVKSQSEEKVLTINFVVIDELYVKKAYFVDGIKKRLSDFVANFSIIIFSPPDLDLVSDSPQLRRHHLDSFLSSLDRNYHRSVSAYGKIVSRRNRILQRIAEGSAKPMELDFWDGRLLAHAKFITQKREEFFEFLNFIESALPGGQKGELKWLLNQSQITQEKLLKNRERDIAAGMTLSGPQRDDFRFVYKGRDLAYFGSRGEQRMATLALKLAELEYVQVKIGERPILALDDIFSELDWEHREAVLSVVGKQQTIITAAEGESVPKQLLKGAQIVHLS